MFSQMRDCMDDYPCNYSNIGAFPRLVRDSSSRPNNYLYQPRLQPSVWLDVPSPDSNKYELILNVNQFRHEEIDVRIVNGSVVVHGKHGEQADEHGFVSREFTSRYELPDDVDPRTVKCAYYPNGLLTIHAPIKQGEPSKTKAITIPVTTARPYSMEQYARRQRLLDMYPRFYRCSDFEG